MGTLSLFLVGVLSLLCFDPTVTSYLYDEPSVIWQITSMFTHIVIHGNLDHLLGNFMFGGPYLLYLESKLKNTRTFIRLFFILGFAALFSQLLADQFSIFRSIGLIGSSGAIFGIVGVALAWPKKSKLINFISKSVLLFFICMQAYSAYLALIFPMGIAYAAHLGGLLVGALFGFFQSSSSSSSPSSAKSDRK